MPDIQQLMAVSPANGPFFASDLLVSFQRASFLRKNPTEQKNPHELENLMKYLTAVGNSPSPLLSA